MTYVKTVQKEREDLRLKIITDRKAYADKLWDAAYKKAIEGTIDREELVQAAKFCNDCEKAYLEIKSKMTKRRPGPHLED